MSEAEAHAHMEMTLTLLGYTRDPSYSNKAFSLYDHPTMVGSWIRFDGVNRYRATRQSTRIVTLKTLEDAIAFAGGEEGYE